MNCLCPYLASVRYFPLFEFDFYTYLVKILNPISGSLHLQLAMDINSTACAGASKNNAAMKNKVALANFIEVLPPRLFAFRQDHQFVRVARIGFGNIALN